MFTISSSLQTNGAVQLVLFTEWKCSTCSVLVPMGHTAEALEMLETDVGRVAFTEEQRQAAQSLVDIQNEKNAASSTTNPESVAVVPTTSALKQDKLTQRLTSTMRLLHRGLSVASVRIRNISLCKVFLALILLYVLLVLITLIMMDCHFSAISPLSPFPWLLRLHGLLQQMWNTMLTPYFRDNTRS
uniref:Uncharacterized protein n=1 Tax=Cyprinus carpio TaxID=7962 RepID=A0A8C1KDD2_CYPCA